VWQWYSSDKEDWGKVARNNTYDQDYHIKVEISCFGGDLGVEDFLDWLVECDRFYKNTRVSYSRMIKTTGFKLKHGTLVWWDRLLKTRRQEGKRPIKTWEQMKQLLRGRFLPLDLKDFFLKAPFVC
jgi:hypothetical protein